MEGQPGCPEALTHVAPSSNSTYTLPPWMTPRAEAGERSPAEPLERARPTMRGAAGLGTRPARRSFLDRFIAGAARFVASDSSAQTAAARNGLLQRLDPRAKLVTLLALLVTAAVAQSLITLTALAALALALALVSRVGLGRFAVRVWTVAPLLTAVFALPAITNWVSPGRPLVTLWRNAHAGLGPLTLPHTLAITAPGVETAGRLVLRVTTAVTFSALLALTTRWDELLRALRVVFVPRVFVLVLAMTYRYVFLLARLLREMVTARASRTTGRVSTREDRHFAAATAGALFGRSQALGEQAYAAMLARGYDGEPRTLTLWRVRGLDVAWSAAAVCVVAVAVWWEVVS